MINVEWVDYDGSDLEPGMLVLWKKDGNISLVGDINSLLGVCDDCHTDKSDVYSRSEYSNTNEWLKSQIDKVSYLKLPADVITRIKEIL